MNTMVHIADLSVFRSAITNADGTVNVGYLTMYVLLVVFAGAVPMMIIGAFIEMWYGVPVLNPTGAVVGYTHEFKVSGLGAGIGFAAGGLATSLAAIAVFLKADATSAPVPAAQPGLPTPAVAPEAGRAVATLSAEITEQDGGGNVSNRRAEKPEPKARKRK